MNTTLSIFQDSFAEALLAPPQDLAQSVSALVNQPGFSVYRNTVMKACIDALQANYPAVLRLVGEEWFRAVAARHVQNWPPRDARLLLYGADFPAFLRQFGRAAELPYLASVARLDRFWTEAHAAADAPVLAPTSIASLAPEQLATLSLTPHPAARWAWFADEPVFSLWQRSREGVDADTPLPWVGEGALLTRPNGDVQWTALDAAGCAFLDACAAGQSLVLATEQAMAREPDVDLARLMAALLNAGTFSQARA
jgi:hypothetical protein